MDSPRKDTKKSKSKEKLKPPKRSSRDLLAGPQGLCGVLTTLVLSAESFSANPQNETHSDPYCLLTLDNPAKTKHYRTGVRKRTFTPVWNDLHVFTVNGAHSLTLAVKDWNRVKQHRTLATGIVDLHGLVDGAERDLVVALHPQGKLHLCVRFDDSSLLFGLPLADACSREGRNVPLLVTRCCEEIERRGLDDVGLYRVSGNQTVVKAIRDAFVESPRDANIGPESVRNISSVVALLKLYLRELPEPLFTSKYYSSFVQAGRGGMEPDSQLRFVQGTLQMLPKPNLDTIVFLFEHFHRVCANSAKNKMTASSLATCLGPTLLTPAENDPDAMAHYDVLAQNSIVEFMIKHWKDMGLTPEAEPASGEGLSMQATEEAVLQDPAGAFAASEIKTGNDVLQDLMHELGADILQANSSALAAGRDDRRMSISNFTCSRRPKFIKSGQLDPDEFKNLCVHLGLDEALPMPRNTLDEEDECAESGDSKTESKETARARATSVSALMQRWEKRSGSRRNLLAKELEQEAFNKYAKTRYLAWPDFYKLCYDLGHAVRERRVYDDLIGAKGTNLTLARFNEWWKASIYPLLAKGYDTPERARALRQAIHYFQYLDPGIEARMPEAEFTTLHADLDMYGYLNIPSPASKALTQLRGLAQFKTKGVVEFNDFVNWLIKIGALEVVDEDDGYDK